jgi:glutamate/tyrosine decarboxylase-like PLP-dependent enzyme
VKSLLDFGFAQPGEGIFSEFKVAAMPIAEVSAMCHEVGALLHVDAVQALSAANLEAHQLNVEFLSLSAHKICGPKGIGALYVRRNAQALIEPLIYGGGQQNGLRAGTDRTHHPSGDVLRSLRCWAFYNRSGNRSGGRNTE